MRIEELPGELGGGGDGGDELLQLRGEDGGAAVGKGKGEEEGGVVMRVAVDAKRAAVGVGARMLFYPTLVYNVVRNRFEAHFHWWDQVDEHVLLGAVPFPSDVLRLKELGVSGVVTLNETYERLVPKSLYEVGPEPRYLRWIEKLVPAVWRVGALYGQPSAVIIPGSKNAHGIENLVLPTRDYLYAPSIKDLCKAADFIHSYASCGKLIYVHCKAGRGRSTTVVICYLVQYKQMTPIEAYEHVRLRRPRVLLASAQWQAVQEFYHLRVKKIERASYLDKPMKPPLFLAHNLIALDDSTFVMVSESDLEGYNADALAGLWEISLVCRVQVASKAAFSYLWVRCRAHNKEARTENVGRENCSLEAEQSSVGHPYLLQGVMVNP